MRFGLPQSTISIASVCSCSIDPLSMQADPFGVVHRKVDHLFGLFNA